MNFCRVIFIVGKIGITILMLAIAAHMYRLKYRRCTMVPVILIIYCIGVSLNNISVISVLTHFVFLNDSWLL